LIVLQMTARTQEPWNRPAGVRAGMRPGVRESSKSSWRKSRRVRSSCNARPRGGARRRSPSRSIYTWLIGTLVTRSPGLRLTLAHEIERHCRADEFLQGRLVDLLAFVDVDGAPDIPVEAGVEQAGRVLQRSALGKGQLDGVLVSLSRANDATVGKDRSPSP